MLHDAFVVHRRTVGLLLVSHTEGLDVESNAMAPSLHSQIARATTESLVHRSSTKYFTNKKIRAYRQHYHPMHGPLVVAGQTANSSHVHPRG